jgi:hypothetical protein
MSNENNKNTENKGTLCGIFKVNGVCDENAVVLDHFQNAVLNDGQFIPDVKESSFSLFKDVHGEIHRCNVTDKYVESHKKLPLYYVIIRYYSKLVLSELLKIYVYFVVENTEEITSSDQLLKEKIHGKFTLELEMNDEYIVLDSNFGKYRGNKKTKNRLKNLLKEEQMIGLIKDLMDKSDNDKIKKYGDHYSNMEPPTITFSLRDV